VIPLIANDTMKNTVSALICLRIDMVGVFIFILFKSTLNYKV